MKIDESVVIRSVILLSRFDCRDEAEIIVLEFYGLFAAKAQYAVCEPLVASFGRLARLAVECRDVRG